MGGIKKKMYVHPEKALKDGLFNYYQKDIMDRKILKDENTNIERNSDRNFIDQIKRRNEDERMKNMGEKSQRVNESMQDYGKLMMKKDDDRRKKLTRMDENYNQQGQVMMDNNSQLNNNIQGNHSNQYQNNNNVQGGYPGSYPNNNNAANSNNANMGMNNDSKIKKNMKGVDLNLIMHPDNNIGVRQLNEMERNKKFEFQKHYKNMLDSQVGHPGNPLMMSGSIGMQKRWYGNSHPLGNIITNPCN